eukprot:3886174-Prorocentrum_lima.AAC.1
MCAISACLLSHCWSKLTGNGVFQPVVGLHAWCGDEVVAIGVLCRGVKESDGGAGARVVCAGGMVEGCAERCW